MRKKIAHGIVVVVLLLTVTLPVLASGMNYATSWETLGGCNLEWVCSDPGLLQ